MKTLIFAGALITLVSCGGGGGVGSTRGSEPGAPGSRSVTLSRDPGEWHFARLQLEDGTRIDYFGTRDAAGVPERIEFLHVRDASGLSATLEVDVLGRPTRMYGESGAGLRLSWVADLVAHVQPTSEDGIPLEAFYFDFGTAEVVEPPELESLRQPAVRSLAQAAPMVHDRQVLARIEVRGKDGAPSRSLESLVERCSIEVGGVPYPCKKDADGLYALLPNRLVPPEEFVDEAAMPCNLIFSNLNTVCNLVPDPVVFSEAWAAMCLVAGALNPLFVGPCLEGEVIPTALCASSAAIEAADSCGALAQLGLLYLLEGPVRAQASLDIRTCAGLARDIRSNVVTYDESDSEIVLVVDASVADEDPTYLGIAFVGDATALISNRSTEVWIAHEDGTFSNTSLLAGQPPEIPVKEVRARTCEYPSSARPVEYVETRSAAQAAAAVAPINGHFALSQQLSRSRKTGPAPTADEADSLANGANASCLHDEELEDSESMRLMYVAPIRPFQTLVFTIRHEGGDHARVDTVFEAFTSGDVGRITRDPNSTRFELTYAEAKAMTWEIVESTGVPGVDALRNDELCVQVAFMVEMTSTIKVRGLESKTTATHWSWQVEYR